MLLEALAACRKRPRVQRPSIVPLKVVTVFENSGFVLLGDFITIRNNLRVGMSSANVVKRVPHTAGDSFHEN